MTRSLWQFADDDKINNQILRQIDGEIERQINQYN